MSIKIVAGIQVFLIKNLKKDILEPNVTSDNMAEDIAKFALSQNLEVESLGEIQRGDNVYSVFFIVKDSLKDKVCQSDLFLTDFIFEFDYEMKPTGDGYLIYADKFKVVRSRDTSSGYTLEEMLSGEVVLDPSTEEFFGNILARINDHSRDIGKHVLNKTLKLMKVKAVCIE